MKILDSKLDISKDSGSPEQNNIDIQEEPTLKTVHQTYNNLNSEEVSS
jgi:hypothetical protein